MKERINITIDEDIMSHIRSHKKKISEYFNKLAREDIEKNSDPDRIIDSFNREIGEIEEKKREYFQRLEKISIEGTLKERKEAKKALEEEKRRHREKIKNLKEKYNLIKDKKVWVDFFTEFDGKIDMKRLLDIAGNLQADGIMVGAVDLRSIMENLEVIKK